jgi:nitrite reductase/ring-hydroxylating ferredoxin subunit
MERSISRGRFIRLGAAAGMGAVGVVGSAACSSSDGGKEVARGQVIAEEADLAPGSALAFTDAATGKPGVLVHLKSGEFVAYSAECTHQGCTLSYRAKGEGYLACPCHGSVFDPVGGGEVVSGPADEPLPRLRIEVRDERIFRT